MIKNLSNNICKHNKVETNNSLENIEYISNNMLEEKFGDKIRYAVTTRKSGVSKFPYNSLNLAFKNRKDGDNPEINLNNVCKEIGFTRQNAVCVYEDHTDKVVVITKENKDSFLFDKHHNLVYDAMITNEKNIPLVITIADCNAIVMYDTKKNVVANIHSGWKGTTQKIYLKVIDKMKAEFGSNEKDIICIFSPAIQSCCWKTKDKKLVKSLSKYWDYQDEYVTEYDDGFIGVNFPYVIQKDLIAAGVKKENIYNPNICTCCNSDTFFSYRRKTELEEPDYGVQASIVELR